MSPEPDLDRDRRAVRATAAGYLCACINRMSGRDPSAPAAPSQRDPLVQLSARAGGGRDRTSRGQGWRIPIDTSCCGTAGDRGVLHLERVRSATRDTKVVLDAIAAEVHLLANRACEMGLRQATGYP